jgi:group II intron reverse transcriptase/maturase
MNVGEMQRLLSLKAEQESNHKFDDLYSLLCNEDWLRLAHKYVEQNAGSKTAGCDGIDMDHFDDDLEDQLQKIIGELKAETFVACPVRRVYIPKAKGGMRPLGIPSIRDRIVQEALRMILEPIYEADFRQVSFGFRPNRCTMDAIKRIKLYVSEKNRYFWIIEGDIASYFDTIHHRKLMKLLGRRIKDQRILDLIWKFLRAGVMERKLFRDTKSGTPQGGIISPLLANVYLHELDKYMEKYTALSNSAKTRGRRYKGLANYAYVRYADDFVIMCNGRKDEAEGMREEIRSFLQGNLRLNLSMEKTKITHANDGFNFLGFFVQRAMGPFGMLTKVTIPEKAIERHLSVLSTALAHEMHEDSVATKFKAVSRIISGWCRYYQYTNKATIQFRKVGYRAFWLAAHWLGRKFQISMPTVMRKYLKGNNLVDGEISMLVHQNFKHQTYRKSYVKPNPYTHQEGCEREELLDYEPWTGNEGYRRTGWADIRRQVMERDNFTCQVCKKPVTPETCEVDHIIPVHRYKRPTDANKLSNAWTLCVPCHKRKTELDRQRESPVQ